MILIIDKIFTCKYLIMINEYKYYQLIDNNNKYNNNILKYRIISKK